MTGTLAPEFAQQYFDNNGDPLASGKVYTYVAGTSTPLATYTTATLAVENANPVILDSAGRASIFLGPYSYKFVLKTSADATVLTVDGVAAIPLTNIDLDITGVAGQDIAMNDVVFLSDGSGGNTAGRWYKTDADATLSSSAAKQIGVAPAAILTGETGSIRRGGRVTGLSSLTPGTDYYVSATAGALTSTPPTNVALVGTADSTTSLVIPGRILDASSTVSGLVNLTAQTFTGVKTMSAPVFNTGGTWTGSPSIQSPAFTALPTGIGAFVTNYATGNTTKNNNTTVVSVTGLSFSVAANASYIFYFLLHGISDATADWKFTLTGPAAPTGLRFGVNPLLAADTASASAFSSNLTVSSTGVDEMRILSGMLRNGANAGTVQFQFAQNTGVVADTIIYAESCVIAFRIA